jgi:hypothetical protein
MGGMDDEVDLVQLVKTEQESEIAAVPEAGAGKGSGGATSRSPATLGQLSQVKLDQLPQVKMISSFVVTAFAGVMSYLGLKGTELTTVLRNQSLFVELMALFILLAVATAILSVFFTGLSPRHLSLGEELAVVSAQSAVFAAIALGTPIPFVTTPAQQIVAWSVLGVAILLVIGLPVLSYPLIPATPPDRTGDRPDHAAAEPVLVVPQGDRWTAGGAVTAKERHLPSLPWFFRKEASDANFYMFLLIVSLMFTSLAAYTGLRLEVRNQLATGAELQASLQESGGNTVLTLSVTVSHLPVQDFLNVNVRGLLAGPGHSAKHLCAGTRSNGDHYSCLEDPCGYAKVAPYCNSLVAWDVPPDTSGDVDRQLTVPFLTGAFQRVHISSAVCERATESSTCNFKLAPNTFLDLEVPAS